MAFALAVFFVFTYIVVLPLINVFIPAVTTSLPYFLDTLTDWVGLNFTMYRDDELFFTLSARFIVLGTAVLALMFLLTPPSYLTRRSVVGGFKTSKVISLKWYARVFVGCLLLGILFGTLNATFNGADKKTGIFYALIIVSNYTALFSFIHCLLLFFLLGFWNLRCELVYPFLLTSADE